jgi:hypothetical protein
VVLTYAIAGAAQPSPRAHRERPLRGDDFEVLSDSVFEVCVWAHFCERGLKLGVGPQQMHYRVVQLTGLRLFCEHGDCQEQRTPQRHPDEGSAQHTCYMRTNLHCGARFMMNKCSQALAQVPPGG